MKLFRNSNKIVTFLTYHSFIILFKSKKPIISLDISRDIKMSSDPLILATREKRITYHRLFCFSSVIKCNFPINFRCLL